MSGARILVTGGTGFVGRALLARIVREGRQTTLALRRAGVATPASGVRVVEVGEIGSRTDWREALRESEAVIHLAGHVHVAPERAADERALFDEVNHRGTVRLYEEAARAGSRRFVFLSSITVLGGRTVRGRPFDDETEPHPETPYGCSKRDAECALRERAAAGGPDLVILRPPLICGPGVKANLASLARLAALPFPLPLGGIDNRRTLLSIDNLVDACLAVLAAAAPTGTFVLGDRDPVSTSTIVRELAAGMGRDARLLPAPVGLLRFAARIAGRAGHAERLLGDLEVDSSRFRRAFGWQDVTDTAATLRATGAAMASSVPPPPSSARGR